MADQIFKGKLEGMLLGLNKLRLHDHLCDITLLVGSKKFAVHRIVLAASSEYFNKMFTGSLVEAHQKEVSILAVDELIMEQLINFFYTAEIALNENNAEGVLAAASLFQLEELRLACCKFLRRQLDPSNCLGVRDFAESYGCKELEKFATMYVLDAFQWVALEEEFLLLPAGQLVKLISSNNLRVDTEEFVYSAVMRWVKHDLPHRQKQLSQLLSHIRLPLLGLNFLMDTVDCDPLICDSESCHLVKQAINLLLELHPCTENAEELFFVVGGTNRPVCVIMERFGSWSAQWKKSAAISRPYIDYCAAYLDGLVYVVGRLEEGYSTNIRAMDIFDPKKNRWSEGVAPSTILGGLAALQGYLYNVGGRMHETLASSMPTTLVERYDPKLKYWVPVAPLNTARTSCSVVIIGNFLYVLGGVDCDTSLERYDPLEDRWTFETPLPHMPEYKLATASFHGMVYVIGQRFVRRSSVFNCGKYDPTTMTWRHIKPPKNLIHKRRYRTNILPINNHLYAITDIFMDTDFNTCCYIEIYNEETDEWSMCGRMKVPFIHQQIRTFTAIPANIFSNLEYCQNVPSVFQPMFNGVLSRKEALRVLPNFHKSESCFEDTLKDFENVGDDKDSYVESIEDDVLSDYSDESYHEGHDGMDIGGYILNFE